MVSKKGKKKLKGKLSSKTSAKSKSAATSKSGNVSVNVKIGDTKKPPKKKGKKKTTKKAGAMGRDDRFFYGGQAEGFGGGRGGYGYGSLGMAGFQNPYAQSDMIAQTAQRAIYDALGNREIVGTRPAAQAPSVAEQQAAVRAASLRAEVEPVARPQPIPPGVPPRRGDPYYEAEVRIGEEERFENLRRGQSPPAAPPRPRLSRPVLRREQSVETPGGSVFSQSVEQSGTFADIRQGVGMTRRQNEQSADQWGGYRDETLQKRKTRGGKQGFQGVESNAQIPGSGGGSGLLAKYREKYRGWRNSPGSGRVAPLVQEGAFAEELEPVGMGRRRRFGSSSSEEEEEESKVAPLPVVAAKRIPRLKADGQPIQGRGRPAGRGDAAPRKRRTKFEMAGAELGGLYGATTPPTPRPSRASRLKAFLGSRGKGGAELGGT